MRWSAGITIRSPTAIYCEQMLRFPKPLIAAVGGPALAGGAGLVLACDIVVAADSATFGLPEPRRGLVAGMVAPLLAFRIGAGRAGYLLMSATTVNAAEAQRMGLFHEVVPADHLWPRANQLAGECAACAGGVAAHQADAERNDRRASDDAC